MKNWTLINNDAYGNPRHVVHFLECRPPAWEGQGIVNTYDRTVKLMNKLGGRRFHNKQYGGGIVFSSYNLDELERRIDELRNSVTA